ncbi:Cyclin C-dependent kinase CDK8 [Trichoderma guizhouense]|uniref:Cyclin C-dependent kinase CDK8 n=1 Tax=Trichoderma guizhouense TaxID=1491466 RepID=A0A1T3CJ36_9HYPO|nr:Cyclin C-dependent kinase CDK8 [Trichoderma guizhouense]
MDGNTPNTSGNTLSTSGSTPNTTGNTSITSISIPNRPLLACLREACVINPRDNKSFIPHLQLKKICNHQAVLEALALAFPERKDSFHRKCASKVCPEQTPASTDDLQKGPHATVTSNYESGESTVPKESTVNQQAATKNDTGVPPNNSQPCYKIFAILVLIGQVKLIETFLDHPLSDNDLPLSSNRYFDALWSPKRNPASLVQLPHGHEHSHWIEMFINRQWSVLAPYFDADNTGNKRFKVYDFHENEILPIEEVSRKKYRGGFGLVEKIKIHSEHNGFDHEYFALKTMHPMMPHESDQFFKQELDAFQMIKPGGNIIEIRAAFKKGDTRCFLFPWATGGNLNTLWAKSPLDIITSADVQWSEFARWICIQCHGIIKDLHTIHVRSDDANKLFGIHSDIKPDNILHFTQDGSQLGSLKISDMGLMKFHRQDSRTMMSASMGNANQTYRSPEHDLGKLRSRKIDIWAFGCLFAELLTWAIRGFNGVEVFKERRMDDDRDVSNENEGEWVEDNFFIIKPFPLPPYYKMPKRKNSIKAWFTELINELGQNMDDTFFPEFLRFIRKHMLQPDRNRRADCIQVEAFLERLKRKPVENPYWRFNGTVVYRNGNDEDMAENGTM